MNTSINTNVTTTSTTTFSNTRQQAASAVGAVVLTISMLVGINLLATQTVGDPHLAAAAAASGTAAKS